MYITGAVWFIVAISAFFCSDTGHRLANWTKDVIHIATAKAACDLAQVKVVWNEETHYTKSEEVLKAIGIQQGVKMSSIHLDELRKHIEQLPWVRSAIVQRFWPNNLRIIVKEKMPLALWQNNKKYRPLDEHAKVIQTSQKLPADLLLVVGPDAPKHLLPLLQNLQTVPEIYQYVRAAVRIGERRWNLRLFDAEKGVEILLPETNVLDALNRLDAHNKKEKLIKRRVASIDLRTHDKVILKPIETPKQPKKAPKK